MGRNYNKYRDDEWKLADELMKTMSDTDVANHPDVPMAKSCIYDRRKKLGMKLVNPKRVVGMSPIQINEQFASWSRPHIYD